MGQSRKFTQFWGLGKLWRWTVMPFGGINSTAEFQMRVDDALTRAGLGGVACAYVDDVLIWSRTVEEHLQHVRAVLKALQAVGFKIHPTKSLFLADRLPFLGHMVTPDGREPELSKVAAMLALPTPANVGQLQAAIGLLNYYRDYVPGFSTIAAPLTRLTRKDVPFHVDDATAAAFEKLKREVARPGNALRHPDPKRTFIVHTDWSQLGMGGVLGQLGDDGKEYLVACVSRSCNRAEARYAPWRGEALAVTWALSQFRVYLHGRHFLLVTDHRPLLYLLKHAKAGDNHMWRWAQILQNFSFDVVHRAGARHLIADALSRAPQPTTLDCTGAQLDTAADAAPFDSLRVWLPDGAYTQLSSADVPPEDQLNRELLAAAEGAAPVFGLAACLAVMPSALASESALACCALTALLAAPSLGRHRTGS